MDTCCNMACCLPSLKELRNLDSATRFSNDDSAESLLSNCLVLEHLDSKFEYENCKFIVSRSTLKILALDCMYYEGWFRSFEIMINA
ncbi:hypothetical protein SLEP1_g42789 [Rubroshorea leprosula]|uniref:Uncharacterized protein n=1 Tax=Rubroshorea leprosula TaxID=152421 RepID=A0AAV5LB06_9ROSI|nr:hypothetical protein SLEP1_g42789 [Rubroshorea leprosula]